MYYIGSIHALQNGTKSLQQTQIMNSAIITIKTNSSDCSCSYYEGRKPQSVQKAVPPEICQNPSTPETYGSYSFSSAPHLTQSRSHLFQELCVPPLI